MLELTQSLTHLFDRHRIVFWYDDKRELRAEFDALALPGVEKVVLANDPFGLKHRLLRAEPGQKFLVYHEGPQPPDLDNWLLDVQLAHGEFRADQTALWLTELGLGMEFAAVVQPHAPFFQATRRREALKKLLQPDDTPGRLRLKMAAVCAGSEPRLDDILEALLDELAAGQEDKARLLQRCELDVYYWQQVARVYGYTSETPGVRDFTLALFKAGYAAPLNEPAALTPDAVVFLKRWKDSIRHQAAFEALSADCAAILGVEQDLQARNLQQLADVDLFELIDRKILSDLARAVGNRTLDAGACMRLIRQRRQSHWYARHRHPYEAIGYASRFFQALEAASLTVDSLAHGIQQYAQSWFKLDQLYRKFVYHMRQSGQATLLAGLDEQVENLYTNHFLLRVNNAWQPHVDAADHWEAPPLLHQADFYAACVQPVVQRGNKIFVVISDALRYEAAEELLRLIRQEDRYDAELEPALSVLPSFTQLGMAALLPHCSLAFGDGALTVAVDGVSSAGLEHRRKILDGALPGRATAIHATELMQLDRDQSRALIREHDVIYVYHNRIDAVGDKRDSEERTCEAVQEALDDLVMIVKKLANANANNIIVTADHGFIFQYRALEESDFASRDPAGDQVTIGNRRFAIGRGLERSASFKHFHAADIGLTGDTELLIPKSINRLRLKGAGSRYVHGGAALQEVVIPVLHINKKRQSDVTSVDVDILRGSTSVISAGQLTVAFYQSEPVSDKVQPRTLRAGIYTQAGELISDQHELRFDLASENPRERELRVQFVLTRKADEANNREVILRLDEQVPGTSHYQEVRAARYLLRRSFTSDFDF